LAAHRETLHRLASAAEFKDAETASHISRMSRYCGFLAAGLGLGEEEAQLVEQASPMHDIGKIGIPDSILLKPGKLTPEEWAVMQKHTISGRASSARRASNCCAPGRSSPCRTMKMGRVRLSRGPSREDIPLYGRICAVADVFDALTNRRPYKEAFSNEVSLDIMKAGRGSHFDPRILDLFLEGFDAILAIKAGYAD
jgi:putative two-component system response regulator